MLFSVLTHSDAHRTPLMPQSSCPSSQDGDTFRFRSRGFTERLRPPGAADGQVVPSGKHCPLQVTCGAGHSHCNVAALKTRAGSVQTLHVVPSALTSTPSGQV